MYLLAIANEDTSRVLALAELGNYYKFQRPDSGLFYLNKALALARQIEFPRGQLQALLTIGITQIRLGNELKALQINRQATKIADENNMVFYKAVLKTQLGYIYIRSENYKEALSAFRESIRLCDLANDLLPYRTNAQNSMGEIYLLMNKLDSALYYAQLAHDNADQIKDGQTWVTHLVLLNLGRIQVKKGNIDLALAYFRQSFAVGIEVNQIISSNFSIAQLYQQIDNPDSSIYYANKSLQIAQEGGFYSDIIDVGVLLSEIYKKRDPQKALEYNKMAMAYKDSLYNLGKTSV